MVMPVLMILLIIAFVLVLIHLIGIDPTWDRVLGILTLIDLFICILIAGGVLHVM